MPAPEIVNSLKLNIMNALDLIESKGTRREWQRANGIAATTYKSLNELSDLDQGIKSSAQVSHHPREDLERNVIRGLGGVLKIVSEVVSPKS